MEDKYFTNGVEELDISFKDFTELTKSIQHQLINESKPTTKKRGGLNEITELRGQLAEMLKVPIGQVYGVTNGWSKNTIRDTLKVCNNFVNPPALFWKIYNEYKQKYKTRNQKVSSKGRKKGREDNSSERQCSLF